MLESSGIRSGTLDRVVVLGKIRSAVGLAGWVKVESFTDPPENLLKYSTWRLGQEGTPSQQWRAMKWAQVRWSGQELHVQMQGVTERDGAMALRNMQLGVPRSELPEPGPGEFYWDDLLGLRALSSSEEMLGKVAHFVDGPAHPYVVLEGCDEQGKSVSHYVPMNKGRVLAADIAAGWVKLDWTLVWNE